MKETAKLLSDDARSYIERLTWGWVARRNGFGFLCWNRGDEWEGMSDAEGRIWHAINFEYDPNNGSPADHREDDRG